MLKSILDYIFPPRCTFCGKLTGGRIRYQVCDSCMKKLPYVKENFYFAVRDLIKNGYIDEVVCVFEYTGIVKHSLIKYKFYNKGSYYKTYADMIFDKINNTEKKNSFDMIISIPLHRKRKAVRGYNQAYLISKALSQLMEIPEKSSLIKRKYNTKPQSILSGKERLKNIKNAFDLQDRSEIKGKRILIIDDIMTTGSTLNELGKLLKSKGALKVVGAVVASGKKFGKRSWK